MALRALMLRKKIDEKKKALNALRDKAAEFEKREAELETAIEEASTDEEKETVETAVDEFEKEKEEHSENVKNLETEVEELEKELAETEKKQPEPAKKEEEKEEREDDKVMITRKFFGMSIQERDAFFADEKVKTFMGQLRSAIKEKRTINNVGLLMPTAFLPLLKEVILAESKLANRVYKVTVSGSARQRVMGTIPEAVWTEMCAKLNELNLGFNDTEVDGYKVGGFFAVCNAVLEDNDVNLANELLNALGQSIAIALDKAIVYGKGVKMPLGIVTRLAQTDVPDDYSTTARPWADLHTSHIKTGTGKSGLALFKEIALNKTAISHKYSNAPVAWMMSENTKTMLMVESMDKNSSAAIVSGMSNTMPVVGGEIIELSFIPDGTIVYGHLDNYLLAERADTQLAVSEHVRFIDDQTVFKGTARYDGKPVIAEAFGVMSIDTSAPTTTLTFAADTANAS